MDILIIGLFAIAIAWFWYLYTLSKRDDNQLPNTSDWANNPNVRDSINENVGVEPSTEAPVVTTEVATEAPVVTTKKTTKKVAAVKAPATAKAPAKAPAKRQYTKKPKA